MTQFLAANWLWIALIVAMFAMHRGGGCGSHGHGHGHGRAQHRSAEHGDGHADHADHADHAGHAPHPASGRSET